MNPFRSIRWRLQIWYGLLLFCILAGFGFTIIKLERTREFSRIDLELKQWANLVENATRPRVGRPGETRDESVPRPLNFRRGEEDHFEGKNGFYYVVWWNDNESITRSSTAPSDVPKPKKNEGESRHRGDFREVSIWAHSDHCILVGRPITAELAELRLFAGKLIGTSLIVFGFGLFIGWWLVKRAIRPIEDISATAVKIASGDLSQRINVADTDNELGKLATVLNSTFARLDASFAQQARFTADAAHELRTPVTVMLTQVQSASDVPCSVEEHSEAFASCQRASQRMRRLIESLLQLARLDAGQEPLCKQPFQLEELIQECVDLAKPLAEARGIKINVKSNALECHGDPDRLFQVITNLLTNAVHHNKEKGEVHVSTGFNNNFVFISVSDNGPGIPPEHLPHIFSRFYRVDKARTSTSGRTGLGLAISKAIVDAHGGRISVTSQPGAGAKFVVELPLISTTAANARGFNDFGA